jgi:hypothetical protein
MLDEAVVKYGDGVGLPVGVFGVPDAGDGFFDAVQGEVGCGAVGAFGLASGAGVVLVESAVAPAVDGEDEAGAASPAVEAARQALQVFAFSVAAATVCPKAVLDLFGRCLQ